MRRYLRLWSELMRLSWRRSPRMTVAVLTLLTIDVALVAAIGLSMRAAIDATTRHDNSAVLAAVIAALAYATSMVVTDLVGNMVATVADRVGRLDLNPRIHRDIAALERLDHLERPDYLNRVTVARRGAGRLARGMWSAVMAVTSIAKLAVTVVVLGEVSPWLLFLVILASAPIWCDGRGQRLVADADVATAEQYRVQQHLFEQVTSAASAKEIRVTGATGRISELQSRLWDEVARRRTRARAAAAAWRLIGWAVFTLGFTGALLLVSYHAVHGQGTAGDLVLAVIVATSLRQSVRDAVSSTSQAAGARQTIGPYLWLRDYVTACGQIRTGQQHVPHPLRSGIVLDHVSYTYPGTRRAAVSDLSVTLPAGSIVALVGEHGSGKTTLVKLLAKLHEPDEGAIMVDGVDLWDIDTTAWRAQSSAAFQDFGRFRTIFAETVGLGDLDHLDDDARLRAAIEEARADTLVSRLPQGMRTQLGPELGGVDLSEGQWQRAALARALMRRGPVFFVLDEPTASLDAPSEQEVFDRYVARARQLGARAGAITLIVSHRFSTVRCADLILVLRHGRLVEAGSHAELLARGGSYAELHEIQARGYDPVAGG